MMDDVFEEVEQAESTPATETVTEQAESTPTEAETIQNQETQTQGMSQESFTNLDPKALPSELQPYYKSMQADFTRKNQEFAINKKQLEQLGAFNQVAEIARNLAAQDPDAAIKYVSQQIGITPRQAAQVVNQQPVQPQIEIPAEIADDEYASSIYRSAVLATQKVLSPQLEKVNQFIDQNQQREVEANRQKIISQVDSKFTEAQGIIPDVGREAFENSLTEMALYPEHAEYAAIHAAGGLKTFAEKIAANAVMKYQEELKTKNKVSPTLTNPGPQNVVQKSDDFDFENENARDEAWAIIQATKAQRMGVGG